MLQKTFHLNQQNLWPSQLHLHGQTPIYQMRMICSQGEQENMEMAMKESVCWVKI